MTIKQVLIGTLVGAGAVASLLHRIPKSPMAASKPPVKHVAHMRHTTKIDSRLSQRPHPIQTSEARLSLNKTFN
jgi:hypothetical protein